MSKKIPARKSYKRALLIAAEEAYKSEVVDTGMVEHYIGEWHDYASREDWIECRIQEWLDESKAKDNKHA